MIGWLLNLLKRPNPKDSVDVFGDLVEMTQTQSKNRAETAIPGTSDLVPLVTLVPPSVNESLRVHDYGPTDVAEFTHHCQADRPFNCKDLKDQLLAALPVGSRYPQFYVTTPQGHTTYLISSDAPESGIALFISWSLYDAAVTTSDLIQEQFRCFCTVLQARKEEFEIPALDVDAAALAIDRAAHIQAMKPEDAVILLTPRDDKMLDGRLVWNTLHRLGFKWGDMDCFQWRDPTGQTDYLIWTEADDGQLGYVLPEEVATGRQHFFRVTMRVTIARSPEPVHVFAQMLRAANAFAQEAGCELRYFLDETEQESADAILAAVEKTIAGLAEHGLTPGSHAVCMLR